MLLQPKCLMKVAIVPDPQLQCQSSSSMLSLSVSIPRAVRARSDLIRHLITPVHKQNNNNCRLHYCSLRQPCTNLHDATKTTCLTTNTTIKTNIITTSITITTIITTPDTNSAVLATTTAGLISATASHIPDVHLNNVLRPSQPTMLSNSPHGGRTPASFTVQVGGRRIHSTAIITQTLAASTSIIRTVHPHSPTARVYSITGMPTTAQFTEISTHTQPTSLPSTNAATTSDITTATISAPAHNATTLASHSSAL
ncbi:hypothetical protein SprV_0702415600 [Sparganum proliferum]